MLLRLKSGVSTRQEDKIILLLQTFWHIVICSVICGCFERRFSGVLPLSLVSIQYPAPFNASRESGSSQLLVMLHGWGANAKDLATLAPAFHQPHLHLMFPDAPYPHPTIPGGRMWYHIETGEHLDPGRLTLRNWLNTLPQQTNIPLDKTILGGFSQGGAMALDVGLDLPLGGLMSLSGYWHPDILPDRLASPKPVLMIHGRQDSVVPLEAAKAARQELEKRDLAVDYHELDMAHEVTPSAMSIIQSFCKKIKA